MPKTLLCIASASLIAFAASGATPRLVPMGDEAPTQSSAIAKAKAVTLTVENPENITDWVSIGTGRYTDGFITQPYGTDQPGKYIQRIEFQESKANPGLYRLVNPYKNHGYLDPVEYDDSQDHYMIIDATNPDDVYIPEFFTGVFMGGDPSKPIYGGSSGSGKLADGIITFDEWKLKYRVAEESWAVCNWRQTFKVMLPGLPDYDFSASAVSPCAGPNRKVKFTLDAGADVAYVKWEVTDARVVSVADAETSAKNSSNRVTLPGSEVEVTLPANGFYRVTFIPYDADNNAYTAIMSVVDSEVYTDSDWEDIEGTASVTENFMGSIFTGWGPNTVTATIQEHKTQKGLFRLVNALQATPGGYYTHSNNHNHYIVINAQDPAHTYIEETSSGIDVGYGIISVGSFAAVEIRKGYPIDQINASYFGTREDNKITIPGDALFASMTNYSNFGRFKINSDFEVVIPKSHTVTVKTNCDTRFGTATISGTDQTSITTSEGVINVVATPAENINFVSWTNDNGEILSRLEEYEYSETDDITLTANFGVSVTFKPDLKKYDLQIKQGDTEISSGNNVIPGEKITIEVIPVFGYKVTGLIVNGSTITGDSPFEVTLEQNSTIEAVTETVDFEIITVVEGNGRVEMWTAIGENEAPEAPRFDNPVTLPYKSDVALYFFPGKDGENYEQLQSVIIRTGEETREVVIEDEIWEAQWKSEENVLVGTFDVLDNTTISVKFSGDSQAAIETITNYDNQAPEYFNLQGMKVDSKNLVPGYYLVRKGATVNKIAINR